MSFRPVVMTLLMSALGVATLVAYLTLGAHHINVPGVIQALWSPQAGQFDHIVVNDMRLPRAFAACLVGACLGVAGTMIQGITKNPIAEPGLLGLNQGAALATVVAMGSFGLAEPQLLTLVAGVGVLVVAVVVFTIALAIPGGLSPLTLILVGAAVNGLLVACLSFASLIYEQSFEYLRVWLSGSLAGYSAINNSLVSPWVLAALVLACWLAPHIDRVQLGDEVAKGLGANLPLIYGLSLGCIIVLIAASVTLAGPIFFVGLVVPHLLRMLGFHRYSLLIPLSALAGAVLLLALDLVARVALAPVEISVGIVAALVGGPLFIGLVKWRL